MPLRPSGVRPAHFPLLEELSRASFSIPRIDLSPPINRHAIPGIFLITLPRLLPAVLLLNLLRPAPSALASVPPAAPLPSAIRLLFPARPRLWSSRPPGPSANTQLM